MTFQDIRDKFTHWRNSHITTFRTLNLSNQHTENEGNCGIFPLISTQCYGNKAWKSEEQVISNDFVILFFPLFYASFRGFAEKKNIMINSISPANLFEVFTTTFYWSLHFFTSSFSNMMYFMTSCQPFLFFSFYTVQQNYAFTVVRCKGYRDRFTTLYNNL